MLTRVQLLKMLVGLKKANDIDLVGDDDVMRVSCNDADREAVRAMTAIINQIYGHFDYANSPEFLERLEGKSEQVHNAQEASDRRKASQFNSSSWRCDYLYSRLR